MDQRARELGLQTYDSAIPQEWANRVKDLTGFYPVGHVVWCYDRVSFGRPVAVTPAGEDVLAQLVSIAVQRSWGQWNSNQ